MAATGHFENYLFNGLDYNAAQYIVSGTFGVNELIFVVNFMIWPISDLQIEDGRQFSAQNCIYFKVVVESSYYTQMKALFMLSWIMYTKTICNGTYLTQRS